MSFHELESMKEHSEIRNFRNHLHDSKIDQSPTQINSSISNSDQLEQHPKVKVVASYVSVSNNEGLNNDVYMVAQNEEIKRENLVSNTAFIINKTEKKKKKKMMNRSSSSNNKYKRHSYCFGSHDNNRDEMEYDELISAYLLYKDEYNSNDNNIKRHDEHVKDSIDIDDGCKSTKQISAFKSYSQKLNDKVELCKAKMHFTFHRFHKQ